EGTTLNAIKGMLFDYSAPMQKAFGRPVPRNQFLEQGARGGSMHWPEPQTTHAERDYFELMRSLFLRRCKRFVETAQEATAPRQVLLGMDALKQGMQGWICENYFTGQAPRAHHSHVL